nr:MAG TPA: hypothetical protein [Caudoviricetes sp.]
MLLFTIDIVHCNEQVQDRDHNHDTLIGRHKRIPPFFCDRSGRKPPAALVCPQ